MILGPKKEQAAKVGELIAKKAQEAGITTVVFDRNVISKDITTPTKVRLVKAMVFPVVMYGCES